MPRTIDVATLIDGVKGGDRAALARAITLVESRKPAHRALARELLRELTPLSGNAIRLGLSGVPGAGKSTFIDALGVQLIDEGHKVAVLAVDKFTRGEDRLVAVEKDFRSDITEFVLPEDFNLLGSPDDSHERQVRAVPFRDVKNVVPRP